MEGATQGERPGCGVGRGNTMSGLSWRKSGNSLAPLLSPPQQMCVCIRETLRWPLLHPREPIWVLTRRGQGQRARLLLGWALTPLLLLLIVSISNLMKHVHGCTVTLYHWVRWWWTLFLLFGPNPTEASKSAPPSKEK